MSNLHAVYDTEIIGLEKPVFLLCVKIVETGETHSFWHHKRHDLTKAMKLLERSDLTWISFNGAKFDNPLIAAWINGKDVHTIKALATRIINDRLQPWDSYRLAGCEGLDIDHIDLIEVAPGVMVSLKTYAGRMHYPSMVDLPYHHDTDLTPKQCKVLETYCKNDLGVTEALFNKLRGEIAVRQLLSAEYDIDLRSKSDPQIAEAILKKKSRVGKAQAVRPNYVTYDAPALIKTQNRDLLRLIERIQNHNFVIEDKTGSPLLPEWLEAPIPFARGVYKVGIGGLHSQHDKNIAHTADDEWLISDFDVASYYPTIILKCGLVPTMSGGKGVAFLEAYRELYDARLAAKRSGDKVTAGTLKIAVNGGFGKLGSIYSPFYSPDLMLAVTITGQLNLLWLIDMLSKHGEVLSANTDGIMLRYKVSKRDAVLAVVARNAKQTGFEYEETRYSRVALKDVNNYLAITTDGKVKAKGLYADAGLMKNPTAPVCSLAAQAYMTKGIRPEKFIPKQKDFKSFLSIRNVKGGGEQEGIEIGRVARWYMTTETLAPIRYVSNGKKVPLTDGARICMTLPEQFPADLNHEWYIKTSYEILNDMGIQLT